MQNLLTLNPENAPLIEASSYKTRVAARAVVKDENGHIALLKVGKHNYYKLPGGGVDEGEDIYTALLRECLEEIGCNIAVLAEVGVVEEHRQKSELKQTSYCYLAKVVGPKGSPNFTQKELDGGFSNVWVSPSEAVRLIKSCEPSNKMGKDYVVPRDTCLLEAALSKNS